MIIFKHRGREHIVLEKQMDISRIDISKAKYKKTVDMERRKKLLVDTKEIFDENGIKFFPVCGTLLGFIRRESIIPWDPDIDLNVWYYDYEKIVSLKKDFEKLGYKIKPSNSPHIDIFFAEDYDAMNEGILFVHLADDGSWSYDCCFHVGIEFFVRDIDNVIIMKYFDKNIFNKTFGGFGRLLEKKFFNAKKKEKKILSLLLKLDIKIYNFFKRVFNSAILLLRAHNVYPYSWFEKTKKIKIYDLDFNIPAEYEKYLEKKYGHNWRIPVGTNRNYPGAMKKRQTRGMKKYHIKDKNVRNLLIKRGDIGNG